MATQQQAHVTADYFAAIIESSNDAIVGKNLDGMITVWNRSAGRLFRYSREEMIGRSIFTLVPSDRRGEEASILDRLRRGETISNVQTVRVRKDGRKIHVSITVSPIRDQTGRVIGAAKTIRDVTARERALEQSRRVIEATAVAMVVVDRDGCITFANAQSEQLLGCKRSELLGQPVKPFAPVWVHDGCEQLWDEFSADPNTHPAGEPRETYVLRKDGIQVPVEIGLAPMQTDDGDFIVASIIDIRKRKYAENLLTQQREDLKRSNKDLEQFAYVASHDLQEPLRAVAGCVQLLRKRYGGQLDARADEFIGYAVDGCKRMQALIDDLLTFSRVGRGAPEHHRVECAAALADGLRNLASLMEESEAKISSDPLPPVKGTQSQLAMLFQNLLANSIKFRRPEEPPKIHVGAVIGNGTVTISVADNGIGIAAEHFQRIFDIFQRLHTRSEYSGTGIGLAVCRRIVERHGGRIWVESKLGRGSTFYFTLPLAAEVAQ